MKNKYLLITFLIISVLVMTSCGRRITVSGPALTVMPMAIGEKQQAAVADPSKTCGPTDEEEDPETEISRESFEILRLAALDMTPEDGTLENDVLRKLITIGDNTMILARILPNISEEQGPDTPESVKIMQITAETYELSEGELIERGIMSAPILVKMSEDGLLAEDIYLPEIYDSKMRAADIASIFGVDDEAGLNLLYDESTFSEQSAELSSIKYELALAGAFDGFESVATKYAKDSAAERLAHPDEAEYAFREYFLKNGFGYNELTLAVYHEFMRDQDDDTLKIYAQLAISDMHFGDQMGPTAGVEFRPAIFGFLLTDGVWEVNEVTQFDAMSETYAEEVMDSFGDYGQECLDFGTSDEAKTLISELEAIQESIVYPEEKE